MPKSERGQLGINWNAEKRAVWNKIAASLAAAPSTLARAVLEEFMACFATREQMNAVGLIITWEQRPGYYLQKAMQGVPNHATISRVIPQPMETLHEKTRKKRAS